MANDPYTRFENDELILRDELAIDRTLLANERTLLAYLRSGVALVLAGVTMMHFAQHGWFWMLGVACLPSGLISALIGIVRHHKMNAAIPRVRASCQAAQKGA